MYSDPNGESRLYLWDYAEIHREVQRACTRAKVGLVENVFVIETGTEKWGFLDLYDLTTNEFYEVKHVAAALSDSTASQISRYEHSRIESRTKARK